MGRRPSGSSLTDFADLQSPFGPIDPLSVDELRETAYELFFASCRSSPGFGGRTPITYYSDDGGGAGGGGKGGANMAVVSRVKRGLGLRTRKVAPPTRMMRAVGPSGSPKKGKTAAAMRPMTSAEIMRQQMGVSEVGDTRLRKTLMRALVGQVKELNFLDFDGFWIRKDEFF